MARSVLKYVICVDLAFSAGLIAVILTATGAAAQNSSIAPTAPSSLATPTTPVAPSGLSATSPGTTPVIPAPVGHRQPRPSDLPASLQREEQLTPAPSEGKKVSNERSSRSARGRSAVPAFDLKKSCKTTEDAALSLGRSVESCISSEEAAREQLENRWAEFPGAKRADCVGMSKIGGIPSYIEVLTCLELAQDLERIRSAPAETTGFGGGKN
ncbi:MAG: hypothetical protein R3D52_01395 [Xanthobacteraceae bacterium]